MFFLLKILLQQTSFYKRFDRARNAFIAKLFSYRMKIVSFKCIIQIYMRSPLSREDILYIDLRYSFDLNFAKESWLRQIWNYLFKFIILKHFLTFWQKEKIQFIWHIRYQTYGTEMYTKWNGYKTFEQNVRLECIHNMVAMVHAAVW